MRSPFLLTFAMLASLCWIAGCYPDVVDDDDATGDDDTGDDDTGDDDTGDDDTGDDDTGDDDTTGDDDATGDDDTTSVDPPDVPAGSLVISEVMYDPVSALDGDGEWFEILNVTGFDYDLQHCTVSDADQDSHLIADSVVVPAHGRAVLGKSTDTGINGNVPVDYAFGEELHLGQDDDEIILTCLAEVDRIEYDTTLGWPGDEGVTMNYDESNGLLNDLADNWCDGFTEMANGLELGTPGAANIPCGVDQDGDGYVQQVDCDDNDPAVNPGATENPGNGIDDDCDGAVDEVPIGAGDIVITEVMQNPQVADDGDGEWFELRNTMALDASLTDCVLTDLGSDTHVITGPLAIPGHGRAVLGKDTDPGINGGVAVDYAFGGEMDLANSDDEIVLTCEGIVIDEIAWDGGVDWPDPAGASMSLDESELAHNHDGANWCEATSTMPNGELGTPGVANDPC